MLVAKSPYLISIQLLVFGYSFVYSCSTLVWKDQLRQIYSDPKDILAIMSQVLKFVGGLSMCATLLIPRLIRRYGVSFLVLCTPLVLSVILVGFFSVLFWGEAIEPMLPYGLTVQSMIVTGGALVFCLGKAMKFSIFDASKEIAFTALEPENKWSAKAAVDGIGHSVGMSSAYFSQQVLLMTVGSVMGIAPYLCLIVTFFLTAWLIAGVRVGREFEALVEAEPVEAL